MMKRSLDERQSTYEPVPVRAGRVQLIAPTMTYRKQRVPGRALRVLLFLAFIGAVSMAGSRMSASWTEWSLYVLPLVMLLAAALLLRRR